MKKIKVIILFVLVMSLFMGCSTKTKSSYDLSTYIDLESYGFDGVGTAYASEPEDLYYVIAEDYGISFDELESPELIQDEKKRNKVYKLRELLLSIRIDTDKTMSLSNGDEVTVQLKFNDALADELNYEFLISNPILTVSGLKEITEITFQEAFSYVNLEFGRDGNQPEGIEVSIVVDENSPEYVTDSSFALIEQSPYKYGDKLHIEMTYYEGLENQGYKIIGENKSESYAVEGMERSIYDYKMLNDTVLKKIFEESEQDIKQQIEYGIYIAEVVISSGYYSSIGQSWGKDLIYGPELIKANYYHNATGGAFQFIYEFEVSRVKFSGSVIDENVKAYVSSEVYIEGLTEDGRLDFDNTYFFNSGHASLDSEELAEPVLLSYESEDVQEIPVEYIKTLN